MDKPKMTVYVDASKRSDEVFEKIKNKFGDKYHIKKVYRGSLDEKIVAVATATSFIEGYENVCRYILGEYKDTDEGRTEKKYKYLIELGMPGWTLQGGGYASPIEVYADRDYEVYPELSKILWEREQLKQEIPAVRVSKVIYEREI